MNITMKHFFTCAALCAASFTALGQAQAQVPVTSVTPATAYPLVPAAGLYQAFGERAGIRALMDDVVKQLVADPRIGAQFKETKLDHLSKQLTDQVCQLVGGPCVYDGPTMKETHGGMEVTRADFNALVDVVQQAMTVRGISFTRQNQLLALLAPMHRDVITVR